MGDPEFRSDEQVLVRTMGVSVKSIPFEGILTSRRIILVDRAKNILPPKEIPLATIKAVEPGENANREPVLSLGVMAKTGDTRQMILAFSRAGERDEWARVIRESASPSFEQVIRKVIPGADQTPRKPPASAPRVEMVIPPAETPQRVQVRRASESMPLSRKIVETGTAEPPAVKEFDASALGENVFCNRCGNRVSTDSAFCNRCGAPVVAPADAAPKAAAPRQYAPTPAPEPADETAPDARLRQSLSWDDEPAEAPAPAARAPAPKAAKKGLLSGLFGSKKQREIPPAKPRAEPAAPRPAKQGLLSGIFGSKKQQKAAEAPAPKPRREGRPILPKNALLAIVAVVVVILVVAVGALFVYPMLTSGSPASPSGTPAGGSTGTTGGSATGTVSALTPEKVVVKETTRPIIPATGVFVSIDYLGSWKGNYGMPSDLQTAADSGARYYEVVNATGQVTAVFEKKDSSTRHDLTVTIYKNGAVLATGKTGDAYGKVTVSADATTGAAVAANATIAAPSSGNATITTKTTTAAAKTTTAATVKTTAPATNTTTAKP
jgi:hypothetical protein